MMKIWKLLDRLFFGDSRRAPREHTHRAVLTPRRSTPNELSPLEQPDCPRLSEDPTPPEGLTPRTEALVFQQQQDQTIRLIDQERAEADAQKYEEAMKALQNMPCPGPLLDQATLNMEIARYGNPAEASAFFGVGPGRYCK